MQAQKIEVGDIVACNIAGPRIDPNVIIAKVESVGRLLGLQRIFAKNETQLLRGGVFHNVNHDVAISLKPYLVSPLTDEPWLINFLGLAIYFAEEHFRQRNRVVELQSANDSLADRIAER